MVFFLRAWKEKAWYVVGPLHTSALGYVDCRVSAAGLTGMHQPEEGGIRTHRE